MSTESVLSHQGPPWGCYHSIVNNERVNDVRAIVAPSHSKLSKGQVDHADYSVSLSDDVTCEYAPVSVSQ